MTDSAAGRTDCGRFDRARLLRPSWAELDFSALRHNLARARALVPDAKIYFVLKGDGFGFGAVAAGLAASRAGVDGFCAGSPDEVVALRRAGLAEPILLFASTLPDDLLAAAALGAMVTLQSPADVAAVARTERPVEVFLEIDCGLARFGLDEAQLTGALDALPHAPNVRLRGLYAHVSAPDDPAETERQAALFRRAAERVTARGYRDVEHVLASSRVVLSRPDLAFTGVDPGRLIYGALDARWMGEGGLEPTLRAVKSRIIHRQTHPAGARLGIGYGTALALDRPMTTAVAPIGFWDGLNHVPPLGEVLVGGRRCPVIGRRTFQHSILDVTDATCAIGDEVVVLGSQGGERITVDDLARSTGVIVMELIPRLLRALPHVYLDPP